MRLIRYARDGHPAWGFVTGAAPDEPVLAPDHPDAPELLKILASRESREAACGTTGTIDSTTGADQPTAAVQPAGVAAPLASLRLLPPIAPGAVVYCIGLNYRTHVAEAGRALPTAPSVFLRRAASLVSAGEALRHPGVSTQFDYEGELAVVIGKPGRHIAESDAMGHVGAYTCFNDGSVRDYQQQSIGAGKNFEQSGACGPWLVTADALPDPAALTLATRLNGATVQQDTTDRLLFPVPALISYLSRFAELQPGDVIATGTPAGVGATRQPPLWLRPGDRIEVEISGIGVLANLVTA